MMEPAAVAVFERMKMLVDLFINTHDEDDHPKFVCEGDQVYLMTYYCDYIFDTDQVLSGEAAAPLAYIDFTKWRLGAVILNTRVATTEDAEVATALLRANITGHAFASLDIWP